MPAQVELSLGAKGQLDPRLDYAVVLQPRLLLLAGPAGGSAVDSAASFFSGSGFLSWRAGDRTTLALAAAASRGTLAQSPLTQLAASSAPAGGAPSPGSGALNPSAGIRTGDFSSASLRAAVDWQATPTLALGGALSGSHAGGIGPESRLLFPTADALAAEGRATLALTPLDGLGLQAGYTRTRLALEGTVGMLDTIVRWLRRLGPDLDATLGAGVAGALERGLLPAPKATLGRLDPRAEASIARRSDTSRPDLGYRAELTWAPYVDQFTQAVRQRVSLAAELDWQLDPVRRLSWKGSAASAVDSGAGRQGVAAAEVAGWRRWSEVEAGLALGGGAQEVRGSSALTWQWSASVVLLWHQARATGQGGPTDRPAATAAPPRT